VPIRTLAVAPVAAIAFFAAPALGQTLEERAAQVRQSMDSPPPTEMVIDRGTQQIGQPAVPAVTGTSPSGSTEPRRATEGVPLSPAAVERMNRVLGTGMPGGHVDHSNPRGAVLVNDPRGSAMLGVPQGHGPTLKGYVPGVLTTNGPGGGRVGGTSNLSTGGPNPGSAP
jgi:hypothetical protein